MEPFGVIASPPLRHFRSEGRLLDRRRTGSTALMGPLPGLNSCSSAAPSRGMQHLDSKALSGPSSRRRSLSGASLGKLDDISLPPLVESGRGLVRLPTSPPNPRPVKRSRSSSCVLQSIAEVDDSAKSKYWTQPALPPLSASLSTGALAVRKNDDNDVEQVLLIALGGSSNSSVQKASLDHRCGNEMEKHLQELMGLAEGKENSMPKKKKAHRARIVDHHGDNENAIHRKGTGFVHLPASTNTTDRHAKIVDQHGDNENRLHRKGTGFVHLNSSPQKVNARRASIVDDHGDNENNLHRKGTGFIHLQESPKHASICDPHGDNENQICRKGTGFIHLHDPQKHASICDPHGDNENNICRKGTGFVDLSALPKDCPAVRFPDMIGGNENNIQRKGTGFVFLDHVLPRVRIADSHGDNENGLHRKGTGFVDLSKCDCDSLPCSPSSGSCSIGTVDSPAACRNASDMTAPHGHHNAEMLEEQRSLIETL